jgi:general secretion pathway protein G
MPRPNASILRYTHRGSAEREAWSVVSGQWSAPPSHAPQSTDAGFHGPLATDHRPRRSHSGFTLIELMVVMAIIGILATIAVPAMKTAPIRAREAALKEDLYQLRSVIDQFHADRDRYPASLDELVSMGYLRQVPIDPVTRAADWVTETPDVTGDETERENEEGGGGQGIIDVHSASDQAALDGTRYSDW